MERFSLPEEGGDVSDLGVRFCREVERLRARDEMGDMSRLEWMVLLDLARRYPEASAEALGRALYEGGQLYRVGGAEAGTSGGLHSAGR